MLILKSLSTILSSKNNLFLTIFYTTFSDVLADLNADAILADSGIESALESIGSGGVAIYGFLFLITIFTGCFGCQVQNRKVSHI